MIADIDTFNQYTNNFEDSDEAVSLKLRYLKASQEVVENYLGYNPEKKSYIEFLSGIGQNRIYPGANPISAITSLRICGNEVTGYENYGTYIRLNEGVFPVGIENVRLEYDGGWDADDMPESIVVCVLNIASLMMMESNGNIGITGKTLDGNSRSFINYTNFDKWLAKIEQFRTLRLD